MRVDVRSGWSRTRVAAAALVAALVLGGALVPAPVAKPKKNPPEVQPRGLAIFVADEGVVKLAVHVRRADRVIIHYAGRQHPAEQIAELPWSWQTAFDGAAQRSCYQLEVGASNKHGRTSRKLKACRPGT